MPETVRTIDPPFTDVPGALDEIRAGRMVIVVDDEDRENEGDLTLAAEHVTPDAINFMARYGRGLICLTLTEERADHLRLSPMTIENSSRFGTAFTESIEAREGVTTGISAADRAHTIRVAIDPAATSADLVRPGHIFPLRPPPNLQPPSPPPPTSSPPAPAAALFSSALSKPRPLSTSPASPASPPP